MTHRVTLALALVLASASVAFAADPAGRIRVHFIAASTTDTPKTDERLSALLPLLKKNLPYNTFKLLDERVAALQASGTVNLSQNFILTLQDKGSGKVAVTISRDGKDALNTSAVLTAANRPLVIGGFPDGAGANLLVVLTLIGETP